jgi:hypothetical protein
MLKKLSARVLQKVIMPVSSDRITLWPQGLLKKRYLRLSLGIS